MLLFCKLVVTLLKAGEDNCASLSTIANLGGINIALLLASSHAKACPEPQKVFCTLLLEKSHLMRDIKEDADVISQI